MGPDRLVALCAERGIEMVVGLLAILKAGGAYVPLDPAYASDRLRRDRGGQPAGLGAGGRGGARGVGRVGWCAAGDRSGNGCAVLA
ncbi:AMP-binding protein [Burkholderia pseudomallei]